MRVNGGQMVADRNFILGSKNMYANDVLLSCMLDPCMALLTNIRPKIQKKVKKK